MPIRLRKPDGSFPTPLPPEAVMGDPPVYLETMLALVGRNPSFMAHLRVASAPRWSALDELLWEAGQKITEGQAA